MTLSACVEATGALVLVFVFVVVVEPRTVRLGCGSRSATYEAFARMRS